MWRKQLEAKTVYEKDWAMLGLWSFISSLQYDKVFLFLEKEWHVCVCVSMHAQSCPALCNPMNCSLTGSSVHEVFQARILE